MIQVYDVCCINNKRPATVVSCDHERSTIGVFTVEASAAAQLLTERSNFLFLTCHSSWMQGPPAPPRRLRRRGCEVVGSCLLDFSIAPSTCGFTAEYPLYGEWIFSLLANLPIYHSNRMVSVSGTRGSPVRGRPFARNSEAQGQAVAWADVEFRLETERTNGNIRGDP